MKSPWARASICTRGMAGLKDQSKVLSGRGFAEAGLFDEPFDASLAAESASASRTMQEVEVREAGVRLLQRRVELFGGHGEAQGREVGEDLVTPVRGRRLVWRRFVLGGLLGRGSSQDSSVRASVDSRWWDAGRSRRRAESGSSASR